VNGNSRKKGGTFAHRNLLWLSLLFLHGTLLAPAKAHQRPVVQSADAKASGSNATEGSFDPGQGALQAPGSIGGKVVDQSGAAVSGARATLVREGQSPDREVMTVDTSHLRMSRLGLSD